MVAVAKTLYITTSSPVPRGGSKGSGGKGKPNCLGNFPSWNGKGPDMARGSSSGGS